MFEILRYFRARTVEAGQGYSSILWHFGVHRGYAVSWGDRRLWGFTGVYGGLGALAGRGFAMGASLWAGIAYVS